MKPEEKQKTDPVVVDLDKQSKLGKLYSYHSLLIVAAIIVLVGVVAWAVIYYKHTQNNPSHKAVFTVAGVKYTETDLNNLLVYPLSEHTASRATLTEQAFYYYKKIALAEKLGLGLNSAVVNSYIPDVVGSQTSAAAKDSSFTRLAAYNFGINQELISPHSRYSGYAFVFYFAQHIQTGLIPSTLSDTGNAQAIAADKSYAKTKADYYYKELKSNAMSPSKILSAVNSNAKLCAGYLLDSCQSVHFTSADPSNPYTNQLAESSSVITYVNKQIKPGLSPIETGQVAVITSAAEATGDYTYTNAYYYFVDLQSVHIIPKDVTSTYNKDLKSLAATYYGWPT